MQPENQDHLSHVVPTAFHFWGFCALNQDESFPITDKSSSGAAVFRAAWLGSTNLTRTVKDRHV